MMRRLPLILSQAPAPTPSPAARLSIAALALAAIVAEGPTAAQSHMYGIKGDDDRVVVGTQGPPWSAIGRVDNPRGGFCTGTLVGPRKVLTAAHCLWNPTTEQWAAPCSLRFLAGYRDGEYLADSRVARYYLPGHAELHRLAEPRLPARDWAVLILTDDLEPIVGAVSTLPFDAITWSEADHQDANFIQAGYSRDRPRALTRHDACRLNGIVSPNHLLIHECDATFGDSGSPILWHTDDGYQLVAVHIGTDEEDGSGIAVSSSAFHHWLRVLDQGDANTPAESKTCAPTDPGLITALGPRNSELPP